MFLSALRRLLSGGNGVFLLLCGAAMAAAAGNGCSGRPPASRAGSGMAAPTEAFLDTLEERTFHYFWDLSDPRTGLTPDRWPTRSFASISATGFALTAYGIGAERGWVTRDEAARRVLSTLRFFSRARQDTAGKGSTGYRGFFYHFLEPQTGARFEQVELSTMDTALLLAGALFSQSYFERPNAQEDSIRVLSEALVAGADWDWARVRPPALVHGWTPEQGFLPYDWRGYDEAMILYLLALGSPTHPQPREAWEAWVSGYRWGTFHGQPHVGFAPLFGHQYTQVWVDLRGLRDAYMREKGLDYFENSRRAVLSQKAYALENPFRWDGYGADLWGLSACDGPIDETIEIAGRPREFHTYWARGASFTAVRDDGTLCPSASAASLPFAPEEVIPVLFFLRRAYGEHVFSTYGFLDALNPTLKLPVPVHHGKVDPRLGWFDTDYLGIDEGPILAMTENFRTGLVWRTLRRNPHLVQGLRRAGFEGGWLDSMPEAR